ncbi:MAG: hypothetical protein V4506_08355 [Bacteroidota bacterium]
MLSKFILPGLLLCLLSGSLKSQDKENHYIIKPFSVTDRSLADIKSALSSITGATALTYNAVDSTFVINTYRLLDKKVVAGKMLKHYFPLKSIIDIDRDIEPFPTMKHTGNEYEDGVQYEKEKKEWIARYPNEYKKLTEKKE